MSQAFPRTPQELRDEEGVIVGIEEEHDHNYYFTGRSFQFEPIAENTYAVDLAWAEEDWYEPGSQGKVLETRARQTDALYLDYQRSWAKVECMLALSPSITTGEGTPGEDCPDLIVIGSAVCECGERDCRLTVTATVKNIGAADVPGPFRLWLTDVTCNGTPLPDKEVGIGAVMVNEINTTGSTTVEFSYPLLPSSDSGPCCEYTLIVDSHAEIDESCYPAPWGEFNNAYHGTVCCDGEPHACPDLTIEGLHLCRCWKTETGHICRVYIKATITNIAPGVPVSDPFGVGLLYGCTDGGGPHPIGKVIGGAKLAELNATGSTSVGFLYVFATTDPVPPCCRYILVVDFWNAVDESCHPHPDGEHNNLFFSHFCCETPPEDGRCPDLTVSGEHTCVCRETPAGVLVCHVGIDAFVGKDGGPVSDPFEVRLTIDCDDAFPSQEQWKMVAPGQINDGFEMVHFDYLFSPLDPMNPCCIYSLEVDGPDIIDETCFIGGEMNNAFGPDDFCCDGTAQDCPDLVIAVDEAICTCRPSGVGFLPLEGCSCTVTVYGTVTNIGGAPIPNPFDVAVDYGCADGMGDFLAYTIEGSQLAELNTTGSTTVEFTWLFTPLEEDFNCCHFVLIVDSGEEVDECVLFGEANNVAGGMVCCEIPTQECPDLVVTGEAICRCGFFSGVPEYGCAMTVEATVTNIGAGDVSEQFYVGLLEFTCNGTPLPGGSHQITVDQLAEINSLGSTTLTMVNWWMPATGPDDLPCCTYTLRVDSLNQIAECPLPEAEENNTYVGEVCCEDTTPPCPDLVIDVDRSTCSCQWTPGQERECTVKVRATIENIGTQTATHFYCKLESAEGGDSILIASLDPGVSRVLHFSFTFTVPRGRPDPCPLNFEVMADSKKQVDECDEENNLDSGSVCCQ